MKPTHDKHQRALIAQEAARIIDDEGVEDFQLAKRKAAERLCVNDTQALPSNLEIEAALREHLYLFQGERYLHRQDTLRRLALETMQFLRDFEPRLVGSVLKGIAGKHSPISLHVFADAAEEVLFVLMDASIPYRSKDRRLRYARDAVFYPAVVFPAGDAEIEVVIFPTKGLRQPPLSAVDAKPMQRADIAKVERLLAEPADGE